MKFLIILVISFNTFAMTKKEALELFELNSIFSKKEILNNQELCEYQNKILKVLKKDLYLCRNQESVKKNKNLDKINFIENVNTQFNVYEIMINQDFNL